eukprot:4060088-Pyramimonas_sp.AAC.1
MSELLYPRAGLHIRSGGMGLVPAVRVSPTAYLGSRALVVPPLASSCRPLWGVLDRVDLPGGPAVAAVHEAHTVHIAPANARLQDRRAAA